MTRVTLDSTIARAPALQPYSNTAASLQPYSNTAALRYSFDPGLRKLHVKKRGPLEPRPGTKKSAPPLGAGGEVSLRGHAAVRRDVSSRRAGRPTPVAMSFVYALCAGWGVHAFPFAVCYTHVC